MQNPLDRHEFKVDKNTALYGAAPEELWEFFLWEYPRKVHPKNDTCAIIFWKTTIVAEIFFLGKVLKRTSSVGCFEGHYHRKKILQLKKGWLLEFVSFFPPKVTRKHPALPKKTQLHPLQTLRFFFGATWGWWDSMAIGRVRRPSPALEGWRVKGEGWWGTNGFFDLLETNSQDFHLQNGELEDISKLGLNGQFSDDNFNFYPRFFFWRSKLLAMAENWHLGLLLGRLELVRVISKSFKNPSFSHWWLQLMGRLSH